MQSTQSVNVISFDENYNGSQDNYSAVLYVHNATHRDANTVYYRVHTTGTSVCL